MRFAAEGARRVLAGALGLFLACCTRAEPPGSQPRPPARSEIRPANAAPAPASASARAVELLAPEELTLRWPETEVGEMRAVVLLPERRPGERFPVLVAMHGRGEALKGPERGARGWIDDYALGRAVRRLGDPPLNPADFESFVTEQRLASLNALLAREPYEGLIVVCPYTPDRLAGDEPFRKARGLATFLVETLLPRVRRETPALPSAAATGIDGVSLGGRAALATGLLRPEAFGAVAALQAAFDVEDAPEIAARARAARQKNAHFELRLLSSEGDYFLRANRAISTALRHAAVAHDFIVVPGPHDYEFNRGPGAIEMLVYHSRVLRGKAPI